MRSNYYSDFTIFVSVNISGTNWLCKRYYASRYYDIIYSKAVTSGEPLSVEQQDKLMARMDTLADHIRDYEKAGNNVFTRSQARRLDKYLYRKSRQAAGKIGIDSTLRKSVARNRVTYLEKVQEK